MKKKLVAFAVTAAMVVTSAVPVLAWEADKPGLDTSKNEIVLTGDPDDGFPEGIKDESVAGPISDEKTFTTYVDFNRIAGDFEYVLNLSNGKKTYDGIKLTMGEDSTIGVVVDGQFVTDENGRKLSGIKVEGIVAFTWTIVENADGDFYLDVTVDELGDTAKAEDLCSVLIPDEMTQVEYLALNAYDGPDNSKDEAVIGADEYIAIYQDKAPEYVVGVEVIKVDGKTHEPILSHGEPIVVTQPVEGETYAINSITFDDGTVITGAEEISKYVTLTVKATKANGNVVKFDNVDKGDLAFRIAPDKYDDCFITAVLTAKKPCGIFGKVTWGEDAEALAVQQRLAGANRYETAMKVADQMKPTGGFENIFVATGESYADALSATALAKKLGAPILLVNQYYEETIKEYIDANAADYNATVYIVGGEGVVSEEFAKSVDKYNVDVERIAGADRYATNLAILKAFADKNLGKGSMKNILVASGLDYADALSASATGLPVLLVGDDLTRAQKDYLQGFTTIDKRNAVKYGVESYTIIGGTGAVKAKVKNEISGKAYVADSSDVTRLGGENRYATNRAVVNKYFVNDAKALKAVDYVFVASGDGFADALTGGVLAAQEGSPIVLVNQYNTKIAKNLVNKIEAAKENSKTYAGLVVIGGEGVVSNEMVQKIA